MPIQKPTEETLGKVETETRYTYHPLPGHLTAINRTVRYLLSLKRKLQKGESVAVRLEVWDLLTKRDR